MTSAIHSVSGVDGQEVRPGRRARPPGRLAAEHLEEPLDVVARPGRDGHDLAKRVPLRELGESAAAGSPCGPGRSC